MEESMLKMLHNLSDRLFPPKIDPYFQAQERQFNRLHLESGDDCKLEHKAFKAELARSALAKEPLSLDAMIAEVVKLKLEQAALALTPTLH